MNPHDPAATAPMNSRPWWDAFFREHWDANHGSAQTAHFMERLLAGLGRQPRERDYLERHPLDILDWGCAFGEGARRLSEAFPHCAVTGLDFSSEAIAVASRRHPSVAFLRTDEGRIPRDFDVIVTSNCLEHFPDPLAVARDHLRSCRKLYLALVPFEEWPLSEYHCLRFDAQTFPERLGAFTRLWSEVVEVDPVFWNGRQLLVAYGSPEYLAEVGLAAAAPPAPASAAVASAAPAGSIEAVSARERAKWDAYYGSIADPEDTEAAQAFGVELSARVAELLPGGGRVLEAGCGAGQQSLGLARSGRPYELTLMDFSDEALGQARRWFGKLGVGAEFCRGDVLAPGTPDFDLVFNAGVLEHYTFDEQVQFIRGMASRSRRYVLALVPNRLCYWYWVWRLQATASGGWPFGKEVPTADLSAVFEAAGLTYLGQFVGGAVWAEGLIQYTAGLDPELRDLLMRVHRSPLIPDWQKGYLLGAVGTVDGTRPTLSAAWSASWPRVPASDDGSAAALVDTLAMAVAGERRLVQSEAARARQEHEAARREAELYEHHRRERDAMAEAHARREAELAAYEADLVARLDDRGRMIDSLSAHINVLTGRLDHEASVRAGLEAELARQEAALNESHAWNLTQEAQIVAMRESRAFRLARGLVEARRRVAPPGSLPARTARIGVRAARKLGQGPVPFAKAAARHLGRRLPAPLQRRIKALVYRPAPPTTPLPERLPEFGIPGLVSVVLPVYNQADMLADSIETVLAQTYGHFELIVVDDGSSDGVDEVLRRYAGHPKIRLLRQANQKLPKALSNGFAMARGEFWTWTSADNLMDPRQLELQVARLRERPDVAMVYADYYAIDDRGDPLVDPTWRAHNRPDGSSAIRLPREASALNRVHDNFIGPCFMYRGWVGRLLGEYDPNLGNEDYDYWMRLNNLFRLEHLGRDELLYSYRVHDNSLSGRAAELRIVEKGLALMEYEKGRSAYYQAPWAIVVDREVGRRLAAESTGPHHLVPWSGGAWPEAAGGGAKVMALVDASAADRLAAVDVPEGVLVAVWLGESAGAEAPYEARWSLRRPGWAAFAATDEQATRLAALGVEVHRVGPGTSAFSLAVRWADNRSYYEATRPAAERRREPPRPFLPAGRRLRVALQVDDFTQGGAEQAILRLASSLDPARFQVSLLVLGKQGLAVEEARGLGLRVATLPEDGRARHYRRFLEEEAIDLVAAQYSVYGAATAGELAIPFVQIVQNAYVWFGPEQAGAYRAADAHTACYVHVSDEAMQYADLKLGLPAGKAVVIPNGVPFGHFAHRGRSGRGALRRELGLSARDVVFLNVASIHATKGQTFAVRALAEVVRTHPRAKLVLLGGSLDADYRAGLDRLIARLGLESAVRIVDHVVDPAPYYHMADAFLLASFWEGWSLALNEALAVGLPVVASAVGGARDLVTPGVGRLVRPPFGSITELDWMSIGQIVRRDHGAFVAELAEAMRDLADDESPRRVRLPEHLRAWIDHDRVVSSYEALFAWLVQGGQPAAARVWTRAPEPSATTLAITDAEATDDARAA